MATTMQGKAGKGVPCVSLLLNFVYILFIKRRGKLATFSKKGGSVLETISGQTINYD